MTEFFSRNFMKKIIINERKTELTEHTDDLPTNSRVGKKDERFIALDFSLSSLETLHTKYTGRELALN